MNFGPLRRKLEPVWICSSPYVPLSWVSPIDATDQLAQVRCSPAKIPAGTSQTNLSAFTRLLRIITEL